jgi:hypothetical protein
MEKKELKCETMEERRKLQNNKTKRKRKEKDERRETLR